MFVLVTIPHGFCATKIARTCDTRAVSCARQFSSILTKKKIKHATIQMHISRLDVDANRLKPNIQPIVPLAVKLNNTLSNTPSRSNPPITSTQMYYIPLDKRELTLKYWNSFNKRITDITKHHKKILLVDIHSFPKGSFDGAQIAILDIYNTYRPELDKFANIINKKMNLNIKVFNGGENHIQNTYKTETYPLLIEFCEDPIYLLNDSIHMFLEELLIYFKL